MNIKPKKKPINPNFSSGPCSKRPGWSINVLSNATLGRSHRSKEALEKIQKVINLSREILSIPNNYYIAIVPASDTGAIEMAMWSLLGKRGVEVLAWESFGKVWVNDIINQLQIKNTRKLIADYGNIPDLELVNFNNDVVFTWNGTTSGVCVPNGKWIPHERKGLTICDATSAVFSMRLPWNKLDVTTYSWQKVLGGEAQHGIIVLSPKAIKRLEEYSPSWPIPKIFQLAKSRKIDYKLFSGSTINTPSMLCVEDVLDSLNWVKNIGGLEKTIQISNENLQEIESHVDRIPWLEFLAKDKLTRSNTSICLTINDKRLSISDEDKKNILTEVVSKLESERIAYDINSYRDAPLGIRVWGGSTISKNDITILMSWLEWAYEDVIKQYNGD